MEKYLYTDRYRQIDNPIIRIAAVRFYLGEARTWALTFYEIFECLCKPTAAYHSNLLAEISFLVASCSVPPSEPMKPPMKSQYKWNF